MHIPPQHAGGVGHYCDAARIRGGDSGPHARQEVIIPVHVPIHYQNRTCAPAPINPVQLVDCKQNRPSPILEEDLYVTAASAPIEPHALTPEQTAAILNARSQPKNAR